MAAAVRGLSLHNASRVLWVRGSLALQPGVAPRGTSPRRAALPDAAAGLPLLGTLQACPLTPSSKLYASAFCPFLDLPGGNVRVPG